MTLVHSMFKKRKRFMVSVALNFSPNERMKLFHGHGSPIESTAITNQTRKGQVAPWES